MDYHKMKLEPGWFALVIALGTAYVQMSTWWRSRHRVTATLGVVTQATFIPHHEVIDLAEVTVSTVGRPCGVTQIVLHWTDESDMPAESFQWSSVRLDEYGSLTEIDMAEVIKSGDFLGVRRTLADGDTSSWRFELSTTSADMASKPRRFRAEVKLSSQKSIFTNHVHLRPTLIGHRRRIGPDGAL